MPGPPQLMFQVSAVPEVVITNHLAVASLYTARSERWSALKSPETALNPGPPHAPPHDITAPVIERMYHPPVLSDVLQGGVGGHLEQPGRKTGTGGVPLARQVDLDKHVLGDFLRCRGIADHPIDEIDDRSPVTIHQQVETRGIAVPNSFHQLRVGVHRFAPPLRSLIARSGIRHICQLKV